MVGDSTAAGCGVEDQSQGFCAQLAEAMDAQSGRAVEWSVRGRNEARAFEVTRDVLPQFDSAPGGPRFDVVVVLVGVNDVLSDHRADRWEQDLSELLDDRPARLDAVSQRVCSAREDVTWIGADLLDTTENFFAVDDFHPHAAGYRQWAQAAADRIDI